jgi:hypothetical protein
MGQTTLGRSRPTVDPDANLDPRAIHDWSEQLEDPALQLELRRVLTAALDTLPQAYRVIVVLRDVEGLSPENVSQITGLSIAAVKTRTHRARLRLRKCLGEYFSDRPLSLPTSPSVSPPSQRRGEWSRASTRARTLTRTRFGRRISWQRISSSGDRPWHPAVTDLR